MDAVFLDQSTLKPHELSFSRLEQVVDTITYYDVTPPEKVIPHIGNAQVVITNKVFIGRDVMKACPSVKLICISATGTNNVDLAAAREVGIGVCNVVGYATASVVQHTFALMLALATNWHRYGEAVGRGDWARSSMFCLLDYPAIELEGKVLGIVGYGALGQGVAKIARAFNMDVRIALSLTGEDKGDQRVPFAQLIKEVDFLTLHCPLSDASHHLINRRVFSVMKPSAFLINVSRGGIVHEPDLLSALEDGDIAGAALDVLEHEPPAVDDPLLQADLPNLLVTPHCAWVSTECRQRLLDGVAMNIEQYFAGQPTNVVN